MLVKENDQKQKIRKMLVPAFLVLFVALRLLWALWAEQTIAEYLYLLGCVAGFGWMVFYFISSAQRKYDYWTAIQFGFTFLWCFAMFVAYEFGYRQDTVTFFGIPMDSHARIILYDFILLLPGIIFADQYRLRLGKLFKLILFAFVATSFYLTVSAVIKEPDALRMSMSKDVYGERELFYGLPDYSVVYSMALLVPWLLHKMTQSKGTNKFYYTVLLVAIVVIIAVSQFATAFLGTIVCILVYFAMYWSKKNPVAIILVTFICVMFLVSIDSIASWLRTLSTTVDGTWAEKLKEMAVYLGDGKSTGDLAAREDLYSQSFDQFLRSPLLGTIVSDAGKIGGHATFLDVLGLTGLFGAIPCVVMVIASFIKLRKKSDSLSYRASVWSALAVYLIFLFMKNIISAISINYTFFVLLPILFFSEDPNEQTKVAHI